MTRGERIAYYCKHIYDRVEGWLYLEIAHIISAVGEMQERDNVHGDIVEFGVHHGKFLLLIDALREAGERTTAVDVFDAQELSPQRPEHGGLQSLKDNIGLLPWPTNIEILARDTMGFRFGELAGVKFFSIDAGHDRLNAYNDLLIAQEALVPGGIIALDDFYHPYWPGPTEAFYDFMKYGNRRLAPLIFYKNKLFLTTASEHRTLLPQYHELLRSVSPYAAVRNYCGIDCLVMSWDGP